ncbi:hypothetical protein GM708_08950 [Vibrio cholerae]|nr:hypothetical protein [Vibrio cholerae]
MRRTHPAAHAATGHPALYPAPPGQVSVPPTPAPRPGRGARAGGALVLGLALLLGLLGIAGAGPASAGPGTDGWHTGAGITGTDYFVGQHRSAEGLIAYCTDIERSAPDRASDYDDGTTGSFVRSDGTPLSAAQNAALALLLTRWGTTSDNAEAASVQLAVWSLTAVGMDWDSRAMADFIRTQQVAPALASRARAMVDQAHAESGPYTIEASYSTDGEAGGRVDASVRSAEGSLRPGLLVEAVAQGAVFADGATTAAWTSEAAPRSLTLRPAGFGPGRLTLTAPEVPAAEAEWLTPREADVQRLVVAPVSAVAKATVELPASAGFAPQVVTTTSAATTAAGTLVHDALDVSVAAPGRWLTDPATGHAVSLEVESTLWGPLLSAPADTASVPDGTASVGTVTTTVEGPGRYETPALAVPSAGYYVWTERIDPSSARPAEASAWIAPWAGRFGLPSETTLVPWQPALSTKLSDTAVRPGAAVRDTVTAEGFRQEGPDGAEENDLVRLTMYGPFDEAPLESPVIPAGSPVHSQVDVPATNGAVTSGEFARLDEPGCYTVVASFDGNRDEAAFTSPFGIPDETVCVEAAPAPTPEPADARPAAPAPAPAPVDASSTRPHLAETGAGSAATVGIALIAVGLGLGLRIAARRTTDRQSRWANS